MSAAQQVLELAKKDLDRPSVPVEKRDDFSGNVEQIGGDSQEPVAVRARGSAFVFPLRRVRCHLDDHQSHGMMRSFLRGPVLANVDDLIGQHMSREIPLRQRLVFGNLELAVVADAAQIARTLVDNVVEEFELGIAAVLDVQPVGLNRAFQNRAFIVLAASVGGDIDSMGDMPLDLEMRMQAPLDHSRPGLSLHHGRLHDSWHRRNQSAINQCDRLVNVFQLRILHQGLKLSSEFLDDLDQPLRIEDCCRFRQRPQ